VRRVVRRRRWRGAVVAPGEQAQQLAEQLEIGDERC
jgi:hypothetical protein